VILRRLLGGPSAPTKPVLDGVPCRAYRVGEHASALSRMLLWRLVISALAAAAVSALVPFVIVLIMGVEVAVPADLPEVARWVGSPIGFGLVLIAVDYLLLQGRLANALSLLLWAGKLDAAAFRAATGIRNPSDRTAAAHWLDMHPDPSLDTPELLGWRAHLQIVVADYVGAESTIKLLPRGTARDELAADALHAQAALAQGLPFDLGDLRSRVSEVPDPEARARLAAEVAALAAQSRFTCDAGDHLEPMVWARPFVGDRDRMALVTGYWLPIVVMVLLTSVALAFLLPPAQ
jgi:hypothetical protein